MIWELVGGWKECLLHNSTTKSFINLVLSKTTWPLQWSSSTFKGFLRINHSRVTTSMERPGRNSESGLAAFRHLGKRHFTYSESHCRDLFSQIHLSLRKSYRRQGWLHSWEGYRKRRLRRSAALLKRKAGTLAILARQYVRTVTHPCDYILR